MSNIKSAKNENFSEMKLEKRNTSFKSTSEKKKRYSDSYNIITKELKILKKIDEGAYGEVKLAKYQGNMVALKYFKKNGKAQEQLIEEFTKEIKALDKLRHPNILFYMGYFYEKNNFVMVSQFASMGSLYNLLHKKKQNLVEDDIIKIIKQIVQAMIYTHSKFTCIIT
jgi:myosin-5